MKDKVLYLVIGVLVGVIIMQAKQGPESANASVITEPVGVIVASHGGYVLTWQGEVWFDFNGLYWQKHCDLPIPVDDVQFFSKAGNCGVVVIDRSGDYWCRFGEEWQNRGHPPIPPVPANQDSWGGIKGKYDGKR